MRVKLKNFLPLVFILFLAAALRFIFLDRIPTAIGGDELEYILNAKAFFLSGKDLSGTISLWSVFLFQYPPGILPQAELPYFLIMPFIGSLSLSLFAARIGPAFLSVATVGVLYFLTRELFDRKTALLAAFLTAVNPWMIFIGRTAYESTPAMFFYLFGIWMLLVLRSWKILLSLPVFLLAFYSYIGTKVIFLPLIITVSIFAYFRNKKKDKVYYIAVSIVAVVFVGVFVFLSRDGSRMGEILTPFSPVISQEVDTLRRNSVSTPFTSLLENKFTVFAKEMGDKLVGGLSFQYLFVSGDDFFAQWRHGLFYVIESIFLLLGAFYLARKDKIALLFFILILLVGLLPQLLYKQRFYFTPHITLFIPLLLIIIAYGTSQSFTWLRRSTVGRGGIMVIGLLYLVSVLYFLNMYFTQYPLRGHLDVPSRILSHYADQAATSQPVVVFTSRPQDIYKKFLFYSNEISTSSLPAIQNALSTKTYTYGQVRFLSCGDQQKQDFEDTVTITDANCKLANESRTSLLIPQLTDGGEVYLIYDDRLCNAHQLQRYPSQITFDDLTVERLSSQEFCETYITRTQ